MSFTKGGIFFLLLVVLNLVQALDQDFNTTSIDNVDINRAKLLAKFSNIAYCSESKVMAWNCVYCRESGLSSFRPVQFLKGSFDSQGYLGYDDSAKSIIIVFQGSASIENWIANLQLYKLDYDYPGVSGARVHSGFYKSAQSLYDNLYNNLKNLIGQKPGYRLVITGHSQGGANGLMVALMIRDGFGIVPEIQTFGEPRVGNDVYANYWKSRIQGTVYRFTHKRDPVPQLPPTWIGFHHRPTEVWLQNGQGTEYKICDNSGEDPSCHNSVLLPIDVLDHLWYLNIYLGIPCN